MRTCLILPTLIALTLAACIVVPRTEVIYDPQCQVQFKKMRLDVLEGVGGGVGLNCHTSADCLTWLALVGGVSAASVVVSGSIVIVGNTVYWLEKQGRCLAGPPAMVTPAQSVPAP